MSDTYSTTEYFCPSCWQKTVMNEDGPGDYYAGSDYICVKCDFIFCLTYERKATDDYDRKKVAEARHTALKAGGEK